MDIQLRSKEHELLGLKDTEKAILIAISKMGKTVSQISRHTGIPRTSIHYVVKKLKEKSFAKQVKIGKQKFWRSDIPKIIQYLKNIQK